jgi:Rps23 Pro-64 3,4-dihydroxylase Tpa1-like proline 4-hydroxylase
MQHQRFRGVFMSLLTLHNSDGYLYFDEKECRAAGRNLAESYQSATPFPHIVIDDLLDADLLRSVAANYPPLEGKEYFDREQERLKSQFHAQEVSFGRTRNILGELNSQAFLGFLEEMTGIGGLISDPYFAGGGLHVTRAGGHLSVHADFNIHRHMKVERRLNLLVYLNDNWQSSYGGALELWDQTMTRREVSVEPILGRGVVFNTSLDSYHGQPDPLACPPDRDRRSIATYYYTALPAGENVPPTRTTNFMPRPSSNDVTDWKVKSEHFIRERLPTRLQPIARKLNPFGRG